MSVKIFLLSPFWRCQNFVKKILENRINFSEVKCTMDSRILLILSKRYLHIIEKWIFLLSYCNRTTSNNIEQHRTTSNNNEQHRTTSNNIEQHRTRVWEQFPSKHTKPNFLANFLCKCFSQLSVICQRFVLKINNLSCTLSF